MLRLAAEPKRWISVTAAVSLFSLQTCLPEQVARDDAVHHLQHRRHRLGLRGQQRAQRDGKRQNPLAHGTCGMTWSTKCAVVCAICRAPLAARRTMGRSLGACN